MKIKYLSRPDWARVLKREYYWERIETKQFSGAVSLIHILEVKEPCIMSHGYHSIKITDNGYWWLQIAPKGQNIWCTVMFDEHQQLIQYYFDITKENVISSHQDPYFYDLYLDVVLCPDGLIYTLDEDELALAVKEKEITQEESDLAYRIEEELIQKLEKNQEGLRQFAEALFEQLRQKIK